MGKKRVTRLGFEKVLPVCYVELGKTSVPSNRRTDPTTTSHLSSVVRSGRQDKERKGRCGSNWGGTYCHCRCNRVTLDTRREVFRTWNGATVYCPLLLLREMYRSLVHERSLPSFRENQTGTQSIIGLQERGVGLRSPRPGTLTFEGNVNEDTGYPKRRVKKVYHLSNGVPYINNRLVYPPRKTTHMVPRKIPFFGRS